MDFLFFYEHENREYENLLLIKRILQRRGYCVEISHVSSWGYGWHMLFSKPKVVMVPWFRYDDNVYKYTRFFRIKADKIVNFQMEQIYSEYDVKINLVTTQGLAKKGYHVCWGENSKKRMLASGVSENHTSICGSVQMDFFHHALDGYFKSKLQLAKQYNLNENMQWRIFISSFAYDAYSEKDLQQLKESYGDYTPFVNLTKRTRELILDWYEDMLPQKRDILFIYRPHPSETLNERLRELEKRFENFKVISSDSIRHWIRICDTIDLWYSTSIGEIYFAGKNCNILRPEPIPDEYEVEIMVDASFITTYDDFLSTFANNNLGRNFPVKEDNVKKYYDKSNNCLSAERIADYLEKVRNDQNYSTDFFTGLAGDANKYRRMIITSLIGGFIGIFNIRLSNFIPIRKDILRNLEKANIGRLSRMGEIERKINKYIDSYIDNKSKLKKETSI